MWVVIRHVQDRGEHWTVLFSKHNTESQAQDAKEIAEKFWPLKSDAFVVEQTN